MKVSLNWLKELSGIADIAADEAARTLTMAGWNVEEVVPIDLSEILVGRVLTQVPHPGSRKPLWIHQVDLGGQQRQIIAGAPNAVPGSVVPVALPGTTVPAGTQVRDAKIVGEPAQGMLCSAWELRLSDDRDGIMLLDEGSPGQRLDEIIPSDTILDVVDVTNYVLLEYGQPLHAFDLATLRGETEGLGQIRVRRARDGEELRCLDGETRRLDPSMLVIADAERPVALAGVIGGEETAVTDGTTEVLLEAANFEGVNVRATTRAIRLRTEASTRFEKGISPELALAGA